MSDRRPAQALLDEARAETDARLDQLAEHLAGRVAAPLGSALAYALRTSGKRVRAALVLGAYRTAGGTAPAIGGVLAAVEIVHAYSLVHDDLPCMDDDAQRRGRPTTHTVYGVPTATAVGWLLVPAAVEVLCDAAGELGLAPAATGHLAVTLLEAGGPGGMIGGQWLDLDAEGRALALPDLTRIHRGKTGALLEACAVLGGLAAGAGDPVLAALRGYGREIGLAFQVADDVLDATATSDQLGKTAGRDAALAKSTYVGLMGVEAARAEAVRLEGRALAALRDGGLDLEPLAGLARYIITRPS